MAPVTSAAATARGVLRNDEITSWEDLSRLVAHFSQYNGHDWLFRGVTSESHALIPKVGRAERKAKPTNADPHRRIPYTFEDEFAAFRMFKDAARPHLEAAPADDLEWLALAQHHGVPTRLLDWTEGLLIATWFAVSNSGFVQTYDTSGKVPRLVRRDAAIWVIRNIPAATDTDRTLPFQTTETKSYRPPHISARISAQRSVLTLHPVPTDELQGTDIVQLKVRSSCCFEVRKRLDACGVNENSVFPDLQGLGGHIAWRYKNNWLAGYRNR